MKLYQILAHMSLYEFLILTLTAVQALAVLGERLPALWRYLQERHNR